MGLRARGRERGNGDVRGWLVVIGVVFVGFGTLAKTAGFALFGLMLLALGVLAYAASWAHEDAGEPR